MLFHFFPYKSIIFCLILVFYYLKLPKRFKEKFKEQSIQYFNYVPIAAFGLYCIFILIHLFYPGYRGHLQPAVASLGLTLGRGEDLYPFPDVYPYIGMLYGPALAQTQAIFGHLELPVIMRSKLAAAVAFIIFLLISFFQTKRPVARGYYLLLLPFWSDILGNRAEPFLLLLAALAIFIGDRKCASRLFPLWAGILGGIACAFKLHAGVYIAAACLAVKHDSKLSFSDVCIFVLSACAAFLAFFLPRQVSLTAFYHYTVMAGGHGLSWDYWYRCVDYFILCLLPFVLCRKYNFTPVMYGNLILIFLLEFLVTVIGAKPGSGAHHLLPFIPVNAYLLNKLYIGRGGKEALAMGFIIYEKSGVRKLVINGKEALAIGFIIYLSVAFALCYPFLRYPNQMRRSWVRQERMCAEVADFGVKYPGLVMGVTEESNYDFTYLRVLLPSEQINYPGYMDLQFSGANDDALLKRMDLCQIPRLLMPNGGRPFAMPNWYHGGYLFSEAIRESFARHYIKTEAGEFFSVYTCDTK